MAARPAPAPHDQRLPIDHVSMPSEDVSDLRDVVDAINKLCDTMKTSCDRDGPDVDDGSSEPPEVTPPAEKWTAPVELVESVISESEPFFEKMQMTRSRAVEKPITIRSDPIEEIEEPIIVRSDPIEESMTIRTDRIEELEEPIMVRSDSIEEPMTIISNLIEETETVVSDSELMTTEPMQYEPTSEMYFTASEVSLLSDMDVQERLGLSDDSENRRDDRNSVMAGHVAAMREHFESMTRNNTPCPDQLRSSSPSIEVFRTVTNSPDI